MDKPVAPARDRAQINSEATPDLWAERQDSLAAAAGLSVLLVEGRQPPALHVSNNNSICRAFQSSPEHVHLCDPYCGVAYERALAANGPVHYRCHAGLHCFTAPVNLGTKRELAVIGGRAFLTSADYRALAERFRTGDLQELLSEEIFRNVIFAARQDLDDLARRVEEAAAELSARPRAAHQEAKAEEEKPSAAAAEPVAPRVDEESGTISRDRYFHAEGEFKEACDSALKVLTAKHELTALALLLREQGVFIPACSTGRFEDAPLRLEIGSKDARLFTSARAATSLLFRETAEGFKPAGTIRKQAASAEKTAEVFPLIVGDEVKAALLVGDTGLTDEKRRAISIYCREIALPLEVLRLRHELEQRARFAEHLQSFGERITTAEAGDTYDAVLRMSADLLRAERCSLLLFDEASNELAVKAAVGPRAEAARNARVPLGEGVAGSVMSEGRPLVVRNVEAGGPHNPASAERSYKTNSFISYPISIGSRKVGVLNVTDKAGGGSYDDIDLSLIESIAPQVAMALDRAEWREKANQFQLMSITDPLTGMLNRRYLVERLDEELKRSTRYDYPMSFMMIDIDDFKLYNDRNGHQAGDLALEMSATCLKSALRAADVASRYGGEEFCILLPQTSLAEGFQIAERIRRRITRVRFPHGKQQPLGSVTVSIGVSAFVPEVLDTPEKIIEAADRALYLAKHRGKNRVEMFEPPANEAEETDAAGEA